MSLIIFIFRPYGFRKSYGVASLLRLIVYCIPPCIFPTFCRIHHSNPCRFIRLQIGTGAVYLYGMSLPYIIKVFFANRFRYFSSNSLLP